MKSYRLRLKPGTAFGSPVKGDTLFGQFCWALRNRYGETRLVDVLQGYVQEEPFAVISDAFPAGYLPFPTLPTDRFDLPATADRKQLKSRRWLKNLFFCLPYF